MPTSFGGALPLTLADLADYRSALAGRNTTISAKTGEPAMKVRFRELWDRADVFRGRRVTVRVESSESSVRDLWVAFQRSLKYG